MTRALHNFIATHHDENEVINNADALNELSSEFRATADQIIHEHTANPEDLEDLREACKLLGHMALSEIVEMMDVAVAGGDVNSEKIAFQKLEERYPENTSHPGLDYANQRTHADYRKALEMAKENGTLVSEEIAEAASLNDTKDGINFNDIIRVSGWTAREQHGELREDQKKELEELRIRIKERQDLAAMGVLYDEKFDDAVKYDPFADEDNDEEAAA